jgi:hypothetical protein
MRQAIHIFTKDVRHLWPAILAVEILTALFAYVGAASFGVNWQTLNLFPILTQLLMAVGWWYLIAAAIHEEVLPGHHQFWVTRPYSRKSLIAARALFIVAFINVPKMAADCVILEIQGFHAASYWSNLIASQVLLMALWLLPFAALAAITANLRQFILAVLLVWLVIFPPIAIRSPLVSAFDSQMPIGGGWISMLIVIAIVLLSSVLVLFWQYSRRRTAVARMMAIVAMTFVLGIPHLLPMGKLRALEMRLAGSAVAASAIRVELDSDREEPMTRSSGGPPGTIPIDIPLVVSELAEGTDLYVSDVQVEIAGRDGKLFPAKGTISQRDGDYWERINVHSDFLELVKGEEVDVRTSAYFAVLGDPQTTYIEPGKRGTMIPGFGLCRFVREHDQFAMACYTPFRRSRLYSKIILLDGPQFDYIAPGSYSLFPAEAVIGPLVVADRGNGSVSGRVRPRVVTATLLSHSLERFELRGLRLDDYLVWKEQPAFRVPAATEAGETKGSSSQ